MKPIVAFYATVIATVMIEVGCVMILLNAGPHAPQGMRLWFGGLALLAPVRAVWIYRRTIGRNPQPPAV